MKLTVEEEKIALNRYIKGKKEEKLVHVCRERVIRVDGIEKLHWKTTIKHDRVNSYILRIQITEVKIDD